MNIGALHLLGKAQTNFAPHSEDAQSIEALAGCIEGRDFTSAVGGQIANLERNGTGTDPREKDTEIDVHTRHHPADSGIRSSPITKNE